MRRRSRGILRGSVSTIWGLMGFIVGEFCGFDYGYCGIDLGFDCAWMLWAGLIVGVVGGCYGFDCGLVFDGLLIWTMLRCWGWDGCCS
ncbi:hypothetical protein FCV25MIE_08105 [Fagus crenata]